MIAYIMPFAPYIEVLICAILVIKKPGMMSTASGSSSQV
jgi:hypothetical protein